MSREPWEGSRTLPAHSPLQKPPAAPRTWDPPRVARHLERAAAQAYRAYRRTRWLKLLDDAEVDYREPGATRTRRLRSGRVRSARPQRTSR